GNLVIDGEYGKLTIHSDGSYSYQRAAGTPGGVQDVFTYTITDGDGDTANAELTINIADATPTADVPTAGGASTTVYEAGLPGGSDSIADRATTSGTIEFTSADGVLAVSLGGNALTTVDQVFATTGPDGSLTARYEYDAATGGGVIHYSYTLEETTVGDDTSASFPVVITDQDNDSLSASNLLITIVDDQPRAVNDQGTVTEGDSLSVNATDGVLGNDNAGADGWNGTGAVVGVAAGDTGATSATGVATVINGLYGTLTLNADGSYTYVSTANAVTADAVDVFT
ncbi:Ig-like domain-containing protein, partial [Aeromonas caviae]